MPEGRNLRLRKAAALYIEYLLRNMASVTESPKHSPTIQQESSPNGQGGTVTEETTEQAGADSTEVNGDLRKLTDQQN